MALKTNPVLAIAVLVIAASAITLAATGIAKVANPQNHGAVFGISPKDSVHSYRRQAAWSEGAMGRNTVAPPRPEEGYFDYAISGDPKTNKVCAVHAATKDADVIANLKDRLSASYGPATAISANGQRWGKAADFVEIQEADGVYQVLWDLSGDCIAKNHALSGHAAPVVAH